MKCHFALAICLAWPLGADAYFTTMTRHIDGATITAKRSATEPCGVDLDIALTNYDQRLVIIEYTYSGTFDSSTFYGVYKGGMIPPSLRKDSKSGVINASMGKMTYLGLSHLTFADPKGLYCGNDWTFNFIASSYNSSQAQRDYQSELQRKEQARIDEINRRKAEEAERKRKAQQQQLDFRAAQEKAKRDNLAAYRNASPENARCLISEPADIARCEQAKARERDERLKQEADAIQARKQQEAERVAAANVEQASIDGVAKATRDMEANNCAFSAGLPASIPYPTVNTNNARYQADIKRIDALNFEAQQKFFRETKAASDACDARRAGNTAIQQQQQQQLLQQQQALRVQAEQQKRLLAQQKAQADLNAAIQEGKKTVGEAAKNTQTLKNGNANLMDLINNMK